MAFAYGPTTDRKVFSKIRISAQGHPEKCVQVKEVIDLYLKYVHHYILLTLLKENEEVNKLEAELIAEDIEGLDLCSSADASQGEIRWNCGCIAIFEVSYHG